MWKSGKKGGLAHTPKNIKLRRFRSMLDNKFKSIQTTKHVYLIQSLEDGYYKIGVSKHPQKRLLQLQTGNSSPLKLIETYESKYAKLIEGTLHRRNSHLRKEGEWFDFSLSNELSFIDECKRLHENFKCLENIDSDQIK